MITALPEESNFRDKEKRKPKLQTGRVYTEKEEKFLSVECRKHCFGSEKDLKNVKEKLWNWYGRVLVPVSCFQIIYKILIHIFIFHKLIY